MAGRDFRAALASVACWDETVATRYRTLGAPPGDCVLQHRDELVALCEWIDARRVRSYLEVGIWTGGLLTALHDLFRFDRVAACDPLHAARLGLTVRVPPGTALFTGYSHSFEYRLWRERTGPFDLVLIDGDHARDNVLNDYHVHRRAGDRYLAFHDICSADPENGVPSAWSAITEPYRTELVSPGSGMGIGITAVDSREEPHW